MDVDANTLLVSLLVGLVGAALLMYGKRQGRVPAIIVGAVMLVYPYFIGNAIVVIAIAGALILGLWGASRLGF